MSPAVLLQLGIFQEFSHFSEPVSSSLQPELQDGVCPGPELLSQIRTEQTPRTHTSCGRGDMPPIPHFILSHSQNAGFFHTTCILSCQIIPEWLEA